MRRYLILLIGGIFILSGCGQPVYDLTDTDPDLSAVPDLPLVEEACFSLADFNINLQKSTLTPRKFLEEVPEAEAAINGIYFAADTDETLGVAYSREQGHIGDGRGRISGYFVIDQGEVDVTENLDGLEGEVEEKDLVIGTYPLLVTDGQIHEQAREERYNKNISPRSAIGTKTGGEVCFAVSGQLLGMEQWAAALSEEGYLSALNLDGGPISQLAVRNSQVKGIGDFPTRLIIYAIPR